MTIATVLITPYGGRLETLNIDYRNHTKHVNTHTPKKKLKKNNNKTSINILSPAENRQLCIINAPLRPEPISDLHEMWQRAILSTLTLGKQPSSMKQDIANRISKHWLGDMYRIIERLLCILKNRGRTVIY